MSEQIYSIALRSKEDLEGFYSDMKERGIRLHMKRPLSRNTQYWLTPEQYIEILRDDRVFGIDPLELLKKVKVQNVINNESYDINGEFHKEGSISSTQKQWGQIHCAGTASQRNKNIFGVGGTVSLTGNETVNVFNNGRNVDVVIVDDSISSDSPEWESSSSPGQTRFVQYQWFNELNTLVSSIDDDSATLPTGTISYSVASTPALDNHGVHVTGTVVGKTYGWATEANIYNIAITDQWPSGQSVGTTLISDYLRAFHRTKPINSTTGKRNPTVSNHSYSNVLDPLDRVLTAADITEVLYRNVTYTPASPGPSGTWTEAALQTDFGIVMLQNYPGWFSSVVNDVEDAVEEGIVYIGAAGNDNLLIDTPDGPDWDNYFKVSGWVVPGTSIQYVLYYNRGGCPNTPDGKGIIVGALSANADFRRASYTNYGPGVDLFAPGTNILSVAGNTGSTSFTDNKYGVPHRYTRLSGTSMASPQVSGVVACLTVGKERFTNNDARGYLNRHSIDDDMTFNIGGGGLDDNTCRRGSPNKYLHIENPRRVSGYLSEVKGNRSTGLTFPRITTINSDNPAPTTQTYTFTVGNSGASHYTFTGSDRDNTFSNDNDPTINCNAGDTLVFNVSASGHPFFVKTSATTGTGNQVSTGTISGQGTTSGAVTWDTTGVTPGTYYYICQFHSGMVGQIIIS
jgi:subtilisin family serine protease